MILTLMYSCLRVSWVHYPYASQLFLVSTCSPDEILRTVHGAELTTNYFDKHGFDTPIMVDVSEGLGLKVPSADFSVSDVERCVGELRSLSDCV